MNKQMLIEEATKLYTERMNREKRSPTFYTSWNKTQLQAYIDQMKEGKNDLDIPGSVHNKRH